jgi:hypothetical protein
MAEAPDPVLSVDINELLARGVDLGLLSVATDTAKRLYEYVVAAYPPGEAFGDRGEECGKALWENVWSGMQSGSWIMQAFMGTLTTMGEIAGAIGGAFGVADVGATAAAGHPDGRRG